MGGFVVLSEPEDLFFWLFVHGAYQLILCEAVGGGRKTWGSVKEKI